MDVTPRDLGLKATAFQEEATPDSKVVLKWLEDLDEARKLEKDFRKEGSRIVDLYEGAKKLEYQFNILYSNTETMLPALYNSTPRPVVQRRFKDEDPLGKMASKAVERALEYLIDDGNSAYTSFDDLMKSATLEALVPGRGITRFKYDAVLEAVKNEKAAEGAESPEDSEPGESDPEVEGETAPENLKYETVCGEEVPWDRFLHGSAKKWKDVPWCAVEHFMTREELEKNFGEIGAQIPVTEMLNGNDDDGEKISKLSELKGMKVAQVYEIWDKDERRVLFVSPQWKSAPIKEVPDPLQLTGFYPWPRPLTFTSKISTLLPVPLYTMYEEQAKELNRVTVRINKLISALKVRGLYDSTVEGISKVLSADDNVLIPAENVAALLSQGNALEKAIWLMPIEKLVAVLQQLYLQRQQVKTVIYEITGIADIMRGSSQASETLGAQQIKNQWGTLRLKKTQKEVMRYCRESLRIMAEITVTKLAPETLRSMTGLPYPLQGEKQQAQMQIQQLQQKYQQVAQMAQMQGQQPPPPPQIPPQMQQMLGTPTWEDLLAILRDDIQRNYRIDIETNSTVDAEATEDKEDIGELLNAISQFLNGVTPMVQNGTMPFGVAQGILLAVVRRYRFGPELEDQLKQMKEPTPQANPEEIKKQQAQLEQASAKVKQDSEGVAKQQADLQMQVKEAQMNLAMERKQFEMDKAMAQKELDMSKQFAAKELAMQEKMAQKNVEIAHQTGEQKLSLKASMQGEQLKRQAQDIQAKGTEVAVREAKADPATNMKPVVDALAQGFEAMGRQLSEGLVAAAKVPKTAKRLPDGSWSTASN